MLKRSIDILCEVKANLEMIVRRRDLARAGLRESDVNTAIEDLEDAIGVLEAADGKRAAKPDAARPPTTTGDAAEKPKRGRPRKDAAPTTGNGAAAPLSIPFDDLETGEA